MASFILLGLLTLLFVTNGTSVSCYSPGTNVCNNVLCSPISAGSSISSSLCGYQGQPNSVSKGQKYYYKVDTCNNDLFHWCLTFDNNITCIATGSGPVDTFYIPQQSYGFPAELTIKCNNVAMHCQLTIQLSYDFATTPIKTILLIAGIIIGTPLIIILGVYVEAKYGWRRTIVIIYQNQKPTSSARAK